MDFYSFYTGKEFDAYKWLGAHITNDGVVFRTFAPNAQKISLILQEKEYPMSKAYDGNFYEIEITDAKEGEKYEYRIYTDSSSYTDHCDPFGFGMELRPNHKSIIRNISNFHFTDDVWMKKRTECFDKPLNIYEMHLGSWKKRGNGETDWYKYDEIADILIPYLKESGYNYIEILPISEHPCDESWGYQNTGFYAPTSRYGTADDLKNMINALHKNGIGIILDFVPVHFAVDNYALSQYDGTALYEYPHSDVGISEWGSCNFMHSRGEVCSFLQSCANYWLKEYHFDGLRIDAVSRIIYWQGDENRGVNGNAINFIKVMNKGLKERNHGCILIAEDSTNYPDVTKCVDENGLGFDYKWDMGWMHDTLEFFQTAPEYRNQNYHRLTFSMMYFYSERYILPYSHDEVVHGKASILQKMSGQYDDKFPQARAMYLYMMLHPGKKLNFMGNEIGQLREWSEKQEQDWLLKKYPNHDAFYHYMSELNNLYLTYSAFYKLDYTEDGFKWLDCHCEDKCIYVIERLADNNHLVGIFNFSNQRYENYKLNLSNIKNINVLLNTDWEYFGGNTLKEEKTYKLNDYGIILSLNAYSGLLIEIDY